MYASAFPSLTVTFLFLVLTRRRISRGDQNDRPRTRIGRKATPVRRRPRQSYAPRKSAATLASPNQNGPRILPPNTHRHCGSPSVAWRRGGSGPGRAASFRRLPGQRRRVAAILSASLTAHDRLGVRRAGGARRRLARSPNATLGKRPHFHPARSRGSAHNPQEPRPHWRHRDPASLRYLGTASSLFFFFLDSGRGKGGWAGRAEPTDRPACQLAANDGRTGVDVQESTVQRAERARVRSRALSRVNNEWRARRPPLYGTENE